VGVLFVGASTSGSTSGIAAGNGSGAITLGGAGGTSSAGRSIGFAARTVVHALAATSSTAPRANLWIMSFTAFFIPGER
jgi:hypothetical protein